MSDRPRNIRRKKEFYSYAVKILRHGFTDPETQRRAGKLVDGFEAADGFDLRKIDEWTPAQKAKVTKTFTAIDTLAARPHKVVRPRRKDHLDRLQKASQHRTKVKGLKVAFVPVGDPTNDIEIKYTDTAVKIKEKNVNRWFVELDPINLVTDLEGEIRSKIEANPARVYNVAAGEFFIRKPLYNANQVIKEINAMMDEYNADDYDPDDPNSSYFGNWLGGVIAYNYETADDGRDYRTGRQRFKTKFKAARKAHRRKVDKLIEKRRKQRNKMRGL